MRISSIHVQCISGVRERERERSHDCIVCMLPCKWLYLWVSAAEPRLGWEGENSPWGLWLP